MITRVTQTCKCGKVLERFLAVKNPICFDCKMAQNREKSKARYHKLHLKLAELPVKTGGLS